VPHPMVRQTRIRRRLNDDDDEEESEEEPPHAMRRQVDIARELSPNAEETVPHPMVRQAAVARNAAREQLAENLETLHNLEVRVEELRNQQEKALASAEEPVPHPMVRQSQIAREEPVPQAMSRAVPPAAAEEIARDLGLIPEEPVPHPMVRQRRARSPEAAEQQREHKMAREELEQMAEEPVPQAMSRAVPPAAAEEIARDLGLIPEEPVPHPMVRQRRARSPEAAEQQREHKMAREELEQMAEEPVPHPMVRQSQIAAREERAIAPAVAEEIARDLVPEEPVPHPMLRQAELARERRSPPPIPKIRGRPPARRESSPQRLRSRSRSPESRQQPEEPVPHPMLRQSEIAGGPRVQHISTRMLRPEPVPQGLSRALPAAQAEEIARDLGLIPEEPVPHPMVRQAEVARERREKQPPAPAPPVVVVAPPPSGNKRARKLVIRYGDAAPSPSPAPKAPTLPVIEVENRPAGVGGRKQHATKSHYVTDRPSAVNAAGGRLATPSLGSTLSSGPVTIATDDDNNPPPPPSRFNADWGPGHPEFDRLHPPKAPAADRVRFKLPVVEIEKPVMVPLSAVMPEEEATPKSAPAAAEAAEEGGGGAIPIAAPPHHNSRLEKARARLQQRGHSSGGAAALGSLPRDTSKLRFVDQQEYWREKAEEADRIMRNIRQEQQQQPPPQQYAPPLPYYSYNPPPVAPMMMIRASPGPSYGANIMPEEPVPRAITITKTY
jgi:hypothetical protein